MKDEQTRLAIAALKAAGCGVLAIHVESRITELEKDAARLKVILDAQDSDDEECQFAVMKNAHYDCYQSAEDLLEAIDTAKKKD